MFENLGPLEMLLIVVIVIVLFGAKRVPEIAASVGKGIRQFKGALSGEGLVDSVMRHDAADRQASAAANSPAGGEGERRDSPKRLMEHAPVAADSPREQPTAATIYGTPPEIPYREKEMP